MQPKIIKIGATAGAIAATLATIKIFFPDINVEIASVDYVDRQDNEIQAVITEQLKTIESYSKESYADGKAGIITELSLAKCEGRITAKGLEILKQAFKDFEKAKHRKHSFDGESQQVVCGILASP